MWSVGNICDRHTILVGVSSGWDSIEVEFATIHSRASSYQTITLTTTVNECKRFCTNIIGRLASLIRLRKGYEVAGSSFLHALDAFSQKKQKSLQADRLVVYQSTYSPALCLAANLLDEGLESRPTLLADCFSRRNATSLM
jgi:hypothetical protein